MAKIVVMKKPRPADDESVVKTTIRLPRPIWHAAKVRALEERVDFQDLVAHAIEQYLKQREGRR